MVGKMGVTAHMLSHESGLSLSCELWAELTYKLATEALHPNAFDVYCCQADSKKETSQLEWTASSKITAKTIVYLFLSQIARSQYLQAEPSLCGNSIFGTASDEAQPGSLWLEGFQVLPLQEPTVIDVGFSLLPGAYIMLLLLLLPSRQMCCLGASSHTIW